MLDGRFTDEWDSDTMCECGKPLSDHDADMEVRKDEDGKKFYATVPCCCGYECHQFRPVKSVK